MDTFHPDDRPRLHSSTEQRPPAIAAQTTRPEAVGSRFAISATHPLASLAGRDIMRQGGNAIDAGVAAGLVLTVVEPHMCSFGGVAPIMVMRPGMAAPETLDGVGTWPSGITLEDYRDWFDGDMPIGMERSVVPGAPASWLTALQRHGRLSLAEVAAPAIALCLEGFAVDEGLAGFANHFESRLRHWPSSYAQWFPDGQPLRAGQALRQPELGGLFDTLVAAEAQALAGGAPRAEAIGQATRAFYTGSVAQRLSAFAAEQGWLLDAADLAAYQVAIAAAPSVDYRGHQVHFCGPWSQGPMVGLALNLLEGFDIADMLAQRPEEFFHLVCEAIKLAAADREAYFGDPAFVDVPMRGLLDKRYAQQRRAALLETPEMNGLAEPGNPWVFEARPGQAGGRPPVREGIGAPDTSHVCTMDDEGNAFCATPSDHVFGSPMVPGLGIVISHRGAQLWTDPEHPCAIAPGKRPRLTPNPAMVVSDGRPVIVFGSPGEDAQTQALVQWLCRRLDQGMPLQEAIEAPRLASHGFPSSFHPHASKPGEVWVEAHAGEVVIQALEQRGHKVRRLPKFSYGVGALGAIEYEQGYLRAGADPRRSGIALAL